MNFKIMKIKSSMIAGKNKKWILIIYLYKIISIHLYTNQEGTKQTFKSFVDMRKILKSSKFII